jgi:hypothetical protein
MTASVAACHGGSGCFRVMRPLRRRAGRRQDEPASATAEVQEPAAVAPPVALGQTVDEHAAGMRDR